MTALAAQNAELLSEQPSWRRRGGARGFPGEDEMVSNITCT